MTSDGFTPARVRAKAGEPLTLVVYPGANGASSLYEDDGATLAYQKNQGTVRFTMRWTDATRQLTVTPAAGAAARTFRVRLAGAAATKTLTVPAGRAATITL